MYATLSKKLLPPTLKNAQTAKERPTWTHCFLLFCSTRPIMYFKVSIVLLGSNPYFFLSGKLFSFAGI